MIRVCAACRTSFEAKGAWQKLCWDCWRERKAHETAREVRAAEEFAYDRGWNEGYLKGSAAN